MQDQSVVLGDPYPFDLPAYSHLCLLDYHRGTIGAELAVDVLLLAVLTGLGPVADVPLVGEALVALVLVLDPGV